MLLFATADIQVELPGSEPVFCLADLRDEPADDFIQPDAPDDDARQ